jgi:hypothetical protein
VDQPIPPSKAQVSRIFFIKYFGLYHFRISLLWKILMESWKNKWKKKESIFAVAENKLERK